MIVQILERRNLGIVKANNPGFLVVGVVMDLSFYPLPRYASASYSDRVPHDAFNSSV